MSMAALNFVNSTEAAILLGRVARSVEWKRWILPQKSQGWNRFIIESCHKL
jgi:hypothetical protein